MELEAYKDFSLKDREGEIWKDIYDYEGSYQISNHGRVKSCQRTVSTPSHQYKKSHTIKERILKQKIRTDGYLVVTLCKEGVCFELYISKNVYLHFIGDDFTENTYFITHKDKNIKNNHINNLTLSSSGGYRKNKYIGVDNRAKNMPSKPYYSRAIVTQDKKQIHYSLGYFVTEIEAAKAYDEFIVKHNLKRKGNFIDNR